MIQYLDEHLPNGLVLDVGAGNGYTAESLQNDARNIVALEPDGGMIDSSRALLWTKGLAQELPFRDSAFAGAYVTWAYFLSDLPKDAGLRELHRVVQWGGPLIIVDNAGDDDFWDLTGIQYNSDLEWWSRMGFESHLIEASFRFDSVDEAKRLIEFYFGAHVGMNISRSEYSFNVFAHIRASTGAQDRAAM